LDVDTNKLTSLPSSFWNFTKLKTLFLYNNKLKTLPSSLTKLTKLEELKLSGNSDLWGLSNYFDWGSESETAKVVDTNWDWIPNKKMKIEWDYNYNIIITTWN